jgi:DNA-binding XRE family transcriptional regulator
VIFEPKHAQANQREAVVLTKALMRAARKHLGLRRRQLATLLCVSETSIGRFARAERCLRPASKQWELALMLVDLYQALCSH